MAPASEPPITLKLLLIGASSVGKSSLLLRFTDDMFLSSDETSATIGVDYKHKMITRNGKRYKLSIWDTAGQERFRTLTSSYYRGAHGVLIVYDVTSRETFDALPSWFTELDTFTSSPLIVRMIVGNKIDKQFGRVISTEEGLKFAQGKNPPVHFRECSAKGDVGVEELFEELVDKILENPELYSEGGTMKRRDSARPPGSYPLSLEEGSWANTVGCNC
ncbi:ras-domain-containing protein [Atractiella rhizophila]|nr:ras-domain-containing protein [Atractiella rhizophila]